MFVLNSIKCFEIWFCWIEMHLLICASAHVPRSAFDVKHWVEKCANKNGISGAVYFVATNLFLRSSTCIFVPYCANNGIIHRGGLVMWNQLFFWELSCNRVVGLLLDSTIWPRYGEGTVKNRFPKYVILGTFGVILGDLTHYIQGINSIDTICENSAQTKTLLSKGNTSDCYWRQWTPQIWRQRFLFSEKNSGADPWTDTILQSQQIFRLFFPHN